MVGYYLDLARRSLKRNVALTVLMIVAIAFGVGASMTMLTVLRMLSADPLPGKSQDIHYVQLDPREMRSFIPGSEPAFQMTRRDAENLLRDKRGDRQAMMVGGDVAIEPQRAGLEPFFAEARYTSADFFAMFRVQFLAGGAWTAADDEGKARVTVIARSLSEKLYGSTDVVGKTIRYSGNELRIVGVIEDYKPTPHFYDLSTGRYGQSELAFVPFQTAFELKFDTSGSMDCWGDTGGDQHASGKPCVWIQYWVEVAGQSKRDAYYDYLVAYSDEQRRVGNFTRPPNVRLRDVKEFLEFREVVPKDAKLQTWIALGFLLVCLINTVGLLLTKFLRRSSEIGVRRALGASKRSIFVQLLVEASMIGMVGGVLGLGLAYLGLWAVRQQPADYAELAQLDSTMLLWTFVLAIVSSLLAGLLPAWRGCQVSPAAQLKSH
jgi:putative ABC transport system permease protein